MTPAALLRAHLDACPDCRSQPESPCADGARLLGAALVAAPITHYDCKNRCEVTGQPAPERCRHGKRRVA